MEWMIFIVGLCALFVLGLIFGFICCCLIVSVSRQEKQEELRIGTTENEGQG